jgi:peptidyl-prolyl cis-trans isomerase SurA
MRAFKTLFFAFALTGLFATSAQAYELDRIVAVVDQDVIVASEMDQEITLILAQIRERGTRLPPRAAIERQVLERMINKRLQLQAAKRLGIQVDDTTLARAIGNIAEKNNLTLGELRDTLEAEGISFAAFREDTREKIILARLRAQEVVNRITVTDREVQHFLESNLAQSSGRSEVHLQHILVALPEGASPEQSRSAKEKAEQLVDKLRAGADFAELALIHSDGRQALEGGDLGWMKLTEVPSLAAEAARSLEAGGVSDPIRSSSGFHVIRVAEIKGGERQLITQTHARHILIKTNELVSDQEARARLAQLRHRLIGGDAFADLARSHSEDTGSAIKGGDLGWVNPGDTVPSFEQEMDSLQPNDISQPFQTPFGWHILQVLERRRHDNTEQMLKTKAQEKIRNRKADEATDLWLRRLRDEAYVEIRLEQAEGF